MAAHKKEQTKSHQVHLMLTKEEHLRFKKLAKEAGVSVAQLCRTLINQKFDKEVNDTALAIQKLEQSFENKMVEFAKSQDIATSFLINNMGEFYETKLEKLQEKVDERAPYYRQALQVFAAHEAVKRKKRAANRVAN